MFLSPGRYTGKGEDTLFKKDFLGEGLALLFILAGFLYACVRAYSLSIVHDEALTILIHASGSFSDIFTFALLHPSNNHLLNTLLIKISIGLFGMNEFTSRIPALIGYGLYLSGTYKLLKLIADRQIFLSGVCLLIFHPFMIDFFSCARGYSLGLGFLMLGLYYSLKRIGQNGYGKDFKNTSLATLMLVLSVISNLTFVNAFIPVMLILISIEICELSALIKLKESRVRIIKQLFIRTFPFIAGISLLAAIYIRPFYLMQEYLKEAAPHYGGARGFVEDTVSSLIKVTLYGKTYFNYNITPAAEYLMIATVVIASSILLIKLFKGRLFRSDNGHLLFITAFLVLCCSSVILQHFLFNTNYVVERTAIYFIPPFLILMLTLWNYVSSIRNKFINTTMRTFFHSLILILLIHFFNCANVTHFYLYKSDAATKRMVSDIMNMHTGKDLGDNSIRIGMDWTFAPGVQFYKVKNGLTWLKDAERDGHKYGGRFTYFYLQDTDYNALVLKNYNFRVVKRYEISDSYLAVPVTP